MATVGPDFSYTAALPPPYNTTTIVRIVDDEGEEGYGAHDADSFGDFETTSLERVRQAAPFLVGTEAWARAPIGELISGAGTSPVPPGALSAIDIAMWDLAAVRAGVPLWQLLGGAELTSRRTRRCPLCPRPRSISRPWRRPVRIASPRSSFTSAVIRWPTSRCVRRFVTCMQASTSLLMPKGSTTVAARGTSARRLAT